ncbi:cation transport protein-domain-containing protein [Mycotypha africana]|uniref:cation transport protein-domain-containing protein n=1 Tax=Mycotypha africana TaxID=64632 RepID=UPI002300FA57|nr:cation transport protein-domain-containing protein [Mycotypha africana]KAI8968232.1 cation transport protein-domain-containing protein [Mycotypha africana]
MATTGSTDTGLNTIAMSDMSTYHMVLLYLSSFLGSHVTVSFGVVMVRRYYFQKRFEEVLEFNKKRKEEYKRQKQLREQQEQQRKREQHKGALGRRLSLLSVRSTPVGHATPRHSIFNRSFFRRGSLDTENDKSDRNRYSEDNHKIKLQPNYNFSENNSQSVFDMKQNTLAHPYDTTHSSPSSSAYRSSSDHLNNTQSNHWNNKNLTSDKNTANTNSNNNQQITFREDTNILRERERRKLMQHRLEEEVMNNNSNNNNSQPQHIIIEEPTIYRTNSEYEIMCQPSAKSQLTKNERYRIGGTEYRALDMLARLVPIYYLGFIVGFGFLFRIYVASSSYAREVLATSNGPDKGPVDPWFFSFFQSLSAFTNLGLNHLDASMAPFQNAPAPLILSIILILVGNTAFAILMRFLIWVCYCLTPKHKVMRRETFRYLLDHPRRCYTTLFPATQTWWLLIVLVAITLVELICFLALNYWLPVLAGISWGSRFLDGLFQSVATRNGKVLQ